LGRERKGRGEDGKRKRKRKEKGVGQRRAPQSIWALKSLMNGNEEDMNMHICILCSRLRVANLQLSNNNNNNNNNTFVERHSAIASEALAEQVS